MVTLAGVVRSMRDGVCYRALIEEPAIPPGYKPWGGGECPEDARGEKTFVLLRDGDVIESTRGEWLKWSRMDQNRAREITAYRVESEQAQPSQQGGAEPVYQVALEGPLGLAWIDSNETAYDLAPERRQQRRTLYTNPLPIPVESLGRAADGVEGLAEQIAELIEQHHPEFADYMPCARDIARRLRPQLPPAYIVDTETGSIRPQVDEAMKGRALAAYRKAEMEHLGYGHTPYNGMRLKIIGDALTAALLFAVVTEADSHE